MCGIAGIHLLDPDALNQNQLERLCNELLLGIEPRGTDATGILAACVGGNGILLDKEDVTAGRFVHRRKPLPENVRTVLLHTRYATKGHQTNNVNNHPVNYVSCFAIHNGHIANDDELFKQYELKRSAEVDSEIIAALLSEEGYGFEYAKEAFEELDGNMAVAVVDPVNHPDELILAKGWGSPCTIYYRPEKYIMWASTEAAIREAYGRVIGTPPARNKFHSLGPGDMIYFKGDGTIDESEFETFRKSYSYNNSRFSARSWSSMYGWDDDGDLLDEHEYLYGDDYVYNGATYIRCHECKSYIKSDKMAYEDKEYAICMECAGQTQESACSLLDPGECERSCELCGTALKNTEEEPATVCERCYDWAMVSLKNKKPDLKAVPTVKITPPEDTNGLVEWDNFTRKAEAVHREAAKEAAKQLACSSDFVEWILFRAEPFVFEYETMDKLRKKVEEVYLECHEWAVERVGGLTMPGEETVIPDREADFITL